MSNKKLTIAFDIGHSSIGWAVLKSDVPAPEIPGCGTVIFPKDDCLASARRTHRRARRNIRSTRLRISRMKTLLNHLGILSQDELNHPGHAAPHWLAAKALTASDPVLDWPQLWDVLRWYAHNRGYDGNARWSRGDQDNDDTEKEKAAQYLMDEHGTQTMAETICAVLGISPSQNKLSSDRPFKTLNAAFPRQIVRSEVLAILNKHQGHLPKLDQTLINCLIAPDEETGHRSWASISVPGLQLPKRYFGGLLFGQLIPRFDNRIISLCPISGSKVPNKSCKEFLDYRWAMLLANIKADGKSLSAEHRSKVHAFMQEKGRLTPTELRTKVEELTGSKASNIKATFEIHPDSKEALELDPALAYFQKAGIKPTKSQDPAGLWAFWPLLTEACQNRALGRWRKGKSISLGWILSDYDKHQEDHTKLLTAIDEVFSIDQKGKKLYLTKQHLLHKRYAPKALSGRSPYSREVMRSVVDFVLSTDRHPTEADKPGFPAGPIYRSKEVLDKKRNTPLDHLTNNHLIRQRLTILNRLTDDIIRNYSDGNPIHINDIVIEVTRDLQEYSGMTSKEMASELTKRLSHFTSAVKYLEEHAPDLEINGSLIRKCRIAMDMDWKCPFTEKMYDAYTLPRLEREHIIPYADRPTNALDAQVLTFDWVNKLKGRRTAFQFIKEMSDDERFINPKRYEQFVNKLKVNDKRINGRLIYPDDYRRQSARKKWLLVDDYQTKDHGFTEGSLTQTSHLNRLSQGQLEKRFTDPETGACSVRIHSLPGQVTAEIRKSWNLLHTLDQACPECAGKNKTEIRSVTHLHHALDAATLALTHHYLPGSLKGQKENEKGAIWQALLKRNKSHEEITLLLRTGIFRKSERIDRQGEKRADVQLTDLSPDIKNQLANRLAEKRVVQHIPTDQSGAVLELNPWRVWRIKGDPSDPKTEVIIRQRSSTIQDGKRVFKNKETTEKSGKLVGLKPGKLNRNKSVLIVAENYGIALDPEPEIIPFHQVSKRLKSIRNKNKGQAPRILRNGMIIKISNIEGKEGVWRIFSAKAPAHLDLAHVDVITMESKGERYWRQVSVKSLLKKDALEIIHLPFTGLNPSD